MFSPRISPVVEAIDARVTYNLLPGSMLHFEDAALSEATKVAILHPRSSAAPSVSSVDSIQSVTCWHSIFAQALHCCGHGYEQWFESRATGVARQNTWKRWYANDFLTAGCSSLAMADYAPSVRHTALRCIWRQDHRPKS